MRKWILFAGALGAVCSQSCSGDIHNEPNETLTGSGGGGTSGTGGIQQNNGTGAKDGGAPSGSTGTGGIAGGSGGAPGTGGAPGGNGTGGSSSRGGTGGSAGGATGDAAAVPLPRLTVSGNKLTDPTGKTIVLRGSSLIDVGALYSYGAQSANAIAARLDKVAAAGVQGHVVRLPVYPEIAYNSGRPTCSPLPYPVATGPTANCTAKPSLGAADYVSRVLKPAVDVATGRNLYVIIDFHQIDNATTGASAADATTFWTDVAPRFASYANVFYEPFNEPIDTMASWATLKPVVQGWIDTIRAAAPNNIIIVPSNSWDQRPGDAASDPPRGTNLMYTAHIYPTNWNQTFQNQVATALTKAPVFITEWGYVASDPNPHAWGTSLEATVDGDGASWTAWVTDNAWTPNMFTDTSLTQLTDFGALVKSWQAAKASTDWLQ